MSITTLLKPSTEGARDIYRKAIKERTEQLNKEMEKYRKLRKEKKLSPEEESKLLTKEFNFFLKICLAILIS